MPELSSAQRRAVGDPASRLQIVACAGSGKTEVLARRAARLLAEGAEPSSIVAFTFTRKAAEELAARIESRAAEADSRFREISPRAGGMFIGTAHAWALQVLRDLGGRYELMDGLTEEREWVLMHRVARRLRIVDLYAEANGLESGKVAVSPTIAPFLKSAAVVHDECIDRIQLAALAPQFAACLGRYEQLLLDMRLLPFRMMISSALQELQPGGRLRAKLSGELSHVLVDEYQDFNLAQDRLLAALADCGAALTVVGDDDQAIYQWRGGNVSLFEEFPVRHRPAGGGAAQRLTLAENRRCRPEIVRLAAELSSHLDRSEEKSLLAARKPHAQGAVEVIVAQTAEQEGKAIAKRIAELIDLGHMPGQIAVLYRSVRTSAGPLVEELRRREIPTSVIGKTSLLQRPEMALIARIFVLWAGGTWYPHPGPGAQHVTTQSLLQEISQVTGLSDQAAKAALSRLQELGERVRSKGVFDSVPLLDEILTILRLPRRDEWGPRQAAGLGRISELLTDFDHAARRAAPSYLYRQGPDGSAEAEEEAEDASLAAEEGEQAANVVGISSGEVYLVRMKAFLEEFAGRAAEEAPDESPRASDAVQVMTVHQAKGLEFPIVFIPSLVEGRFPSAMLGRKQEWYVPDQLFDRERYEGTLDDEARLLYVALTRARELTILSWFEGHATREAERSRLLDERLATSLASACPGGEINPQLQVKAGAQELLQIDFSKLVAYTRCGYQYWLRHVCGFQPPIAPELGFGKVLHHVIAELARGSRSGLPPSSQQVQPLLDEAFYLPFAGPVPAAKLRESAHRRLVAYIESHGSELKRTIKPEMPFEVQIGKACVSGRIDLVLEADGGSPREIELVDFKTSAERPPAQMHANQLRLYAKAAERLGYRPVKIAVHDLGPGGGRKVVENDDAASEEFAGQLHRWVEGIGNGDFPPAREPSICARCDFRSFCQHAS